MLPGDRFANEEVPDVAQCRLKLRHAKPVHWILFASLVTKTHNTYISGLKAWFSPALPTSTTLQLVKSGLPIISKRVWQRLVSWGIDLSCETMVDGRMMTVPDIVHDLAHPSSGSCARIGSHGDDLHVEGAWLMRVEGARQIQQLMSSTLKIFA
jgi:hypothetical protein